MEEQKKLLEKYYKESDPIRRKKILEKLMESEEDAADNQIRMELWEKRYSQASKSVKGGRCDNYMIIWMDLKYMEGNVSPLFGGRKRAIRELKKRLESLGFEEYKKMGGRHMELLYQECIHAATLYIESCQTDKSYSTGILGLMPLSQERIEEKITRDIYSAAYVLPKELEIESELELFTKAAREVYCAKYPADEFDELTGLRKFLIEGEE